MNKSKYNLTYIQTPALFRYDESQNKGNESWDLLWELLTKDLPTRRATQVSRPAANIGLSSKDGFQLIGDETVSLLNVSGQEAHVEITI